MGSWLALPADRVSDLERMVCHELWNTGAPLSERGMICANEVRSTIQAMVKFLSPRLSDPDEFQRFASEHLYDLCVIVDLRETRQAPWPEWRLCLRKLEQAGFTGMTRLPARWSVQRPFLPWLRTAIGYASRSFLKTQIGLDDGPEKGDPPSPEPPCDPPPLDDASRLARTRYIYQIRRLVERRRVGAPVGREGRLQAARQIRIAINALRSVAAGDDEPRNFSIQLWHAEDVIFVLMEGVFEELRDLGLEPPIRHRFKEYVDQWIEDLTVLAETVEGSAGYGG